MKKTSLSKRILQLLAGLLGLGLLALGLLLAYLSLTEFRPEPVTTSRLEPAPLVEVVPGQDYRAVSFNIGYAGLGEESDFFMDGGQMVLAPSPEVVEKNLAGISQVLADLGADFTLLQEVDVDAKRSYGINQRAYLEDQVLGQPSFYAANYKTKYVPYPWPPMGRVDAGLVTASPYSIQEASRVSLTVPFKWPVRLANLKRCLLVTRTPVAASDKDLVVINFHLEAYDDTGGRQQQTQELIRFMQEEYARGNYVVAGGDFNQSLYPKADLPFNTSPAYWQPADLEDQQIPEDIQLVRDPARLATSRSLHAPYDQAREDGVFYLIDGFLVSPNVQVHGASTYDQAFQYSDHNPVVLDFSLAPAE